MTVARLAGIALLALSMGCWLARQGGGGAKVMVSAMVLYNFGVVLLFVYGATVLRLSGIGLWPVVLLHFIVAGWCILELRKRSMQI